MRAFPELSSKSVIKGRGLQSFLVILFKPQKSTQRQSPPSFFLAKRTGAPYGDHDGLMNLVARCSSMNSRRATSSVCDREYICPSGGVEFLSRLIFRS